MRQVIMTNIGKIDVKNLYISYLLTQFGSNRPDEDDNLQIFASVDNTSPSPDIIRQLSKSTKNSKTYFIPRLGLNESLSVLLFFNKYDNVSPIPSADNFDLSRNFHNTYVQCNRTPQAK